MKDRIERQSERQHERQPNRLKRRRFDDRLIKHRGLGEPAVGYLPHGVLGGE